MSNIYDVLFVLQFFICVSLVLVKFYNVLKGGEWYSIEVSLILFVGFFINYALGFVVSLVNIGALADEYNNLLYSTLFQFESWLIILFVLFFIIELVYFFKGMIGSRNNNYSANGR